MQSSAVEFRNKIGLLVYLVWFLGSTTVSLPGCAPGARDLAPGIKPGNGPARLEEQWGIRPESIMLSGAGHLIDFRYRVVDPEKAVKILGEPKLKTYLLDQASGIKLAVPSSPKVGSLRQTTMTPEKNRLYFCIFNNPNNLVKTGSRVTVVMGDLRAEDLVVQ